MQPASNTPDFMLFTGNANPSLAAEIAKNLGTHLGAVDVGRFSDGEVTVELKQNVRAREVFVVQPHLRAHQRKPHGIADHG